MRPSSTCICKHISPINTKSRFTILMHPKEYKKKRTGRDIWPSFNWKFRNYSWCRFHK